MNAVPVQVNAGFPPATRMTARISARVSAAPTTAPSTAAPTPRPTTRTSRGPSICCAPSVIHSSRRRLVPRRRSTRRSRSRRPRTRRILRHDAARGPTLHRAGDAGSCAHLSSCRRLDLSSSGVHGANDDDRSDRHDQHPASRRRGPGPGDRPTEADRRAPPRGTREPPAARRPARDRIGPGSPGRPLQPDPGGGAPRAGRGAAADRGRSSAPISTTRISVRRARRAPRPAWPCPAGP